MKKICKECGELLDVSCFDKSKNVKDGYENKCKICRQKARRKYKNTCDICGNEFYTTTKTTRYCSNDCMGKARQNKVKKRCSYCGKEIEVRKYKDNKQEYYYCNQSCRTEHLKLLMKGKNNINYNRVKYKCDGCGKEIFMIPSKLKNQKYIFCSNECYKTNIGKFLSGENNANYNSKKVKCSVCGKSILRTKSNVEKYNNFYCSQKCMSIGIKPILQLNNKLKMKNLKVECSYCGKEVKTIPSKLKDREHTYCSIECKNKGLSKYYSGKNSPKWNHNLSNEERILGRKYEDYYKWRKEIFEKDNYTCQGCGDDKGHNLKAHHLDGYNWCKEKRTDIDNGITLCECCHKEFHNTYGYGNNTKEQYQEYIHNKLNKEAI